MIGEVRFSDSETSSVILDIDGEKSFHLDELRILILHLEKAAEFMAAVDCVSISGS